MLALRTTFWWAVFIPVTSLFSLLAVAAGSFDRSGDLSHALNRIWARITVAASGCRIDIKGLELLSRDSGQIIAANHQSAFDIYILTAALPLQIRWIAKEELFRIPLMGRGMRASGYLCINREKPRQAVKILRKAAETVRSGRSVIIFPEGERTPDGELGEFTRGLLRIVKKSGAPVCPLTIDGTFEMMPRSSFLLRKGDVKITVAPPLFYRDIKGKPEEEVLEAVRGAIAARLGKPSPTGRKVSL